MAKELMAEFGDLSTPLIADACLKLSMSLRLAPPGIVSIPRGARLAGRVLPAKHGGSVDVFLEAFESAEAGDVLVIDNGGRLDEGCIGDLTVLEAQAAGLAGAVVWGLVRDTPELKVIGWPVFSYGTLPAGPARFVAQGPERLASARVGQIVAERSDAVFADPDGVIFVALAKLPQVLTAAREIWEKERAHVQAIRKGKSLRSQFHFQEYLEKRGKDPEYTFRRHLRALGGAIEE